MIVTVTPDAFHPDAVPHGSKQSFLLELAPATGGELLHIPVVVVKGRAPGKTLVAMAGVHGDEYEGVRAIQDVLEHLDPETMHGCFLAVPVANLPAYRVGNRFSPVDHLNLARVFPGNKNGTITERIADCLARSIISRADFFIDLHSGGIKYQFAPLVGYDASDTLAGRASRSAALALGFPVVWGHPTLSPGRTLCAAASRGVPWLYTEATGAGRIADDDLRYYRNGLVNLLKVLNIVPGDPEPADKYLHLLGEGDLDRVIAFQTHGFFVPEVRVLDRVRSGQVLGRVRNLFGEVLEELCAAEDGIVVMLQAFPVVSPGDPICVLAKEAPTDGAAVQW